MKGGTGTTHEVARRRWTIRRGFKLEKPWRFFVLLRVFRGNGLANFEFEFRLGFPRHSRNSARQIEEMLGD